MIKLKSLLLENNHRINTFKRELIDFIKKYRESDNRFDKEHWMEMIKIAREEIEKEKKKSPQQREHEFDRNQFMSHHYTGGIRSDAYRNYEKEGGLSWLGNKSKYPILLDRGKYGPFEVEFRQKDEDTQYVATDEEGHVKRLPNGDIVMMTPDEIRSAGYPTKDTQIVAFVNDKPIGFASNEFGAVGVWVEGPYQRLGIGTDLLDKHIEQRPDVKSGKAPIGQMTDKGIGMVRKYYDKMAAKKGIGWYQKQK